MSATVEYLKEAYARGRLSYDEFIRALPLALSERKIDIGPQRLVVIGDGWVRFDFEFPGADGYEDFKASGVAFVYPSDRTDAFAEQLTQACVLMAVGQRP